MARYEKHDFDEGKYQSTFDDFAHGEGKGVSRQTINRHFKKVEELLTQPTEEIIEEPTPEVSHDWLKISDEDEGEPKLSSIPSPAKSMLRAFSKQDKKRTHEETQVFQKKQARMFRYLFSGVIDPLTSAYCRGVMGERGKGWTLERTQDDWDLFESVAEEWIEYHEFTIPINPDIMMLGCVGTFYAPPIVHAHKNRDPSRKGLFSKLKGRFISWRAKRKMKKMGVTEYES